MQPWAWFGIVGGLIAPWLIIPNTIRVAFQERGIGAAIAVWLGQCWLTVPLMLGVMWVISRFV